jgi:hypothetical protein
MTKLATVVVDQSTDLSGRHTYRVVQRFAPPDYVKQASDEDLAGSAALTKQSAESEYNPEATQVAEDEPDIFADPWRRLFRCHTKAATWLSAAFFADQADAYPPEEALAVRQRLEHFASFHGIADEVSALQSKAAALRESGTAMLQDGDYALVLDLGNGEKKQLYPLRDLDEVKQAADYLARYRDELPFGHKNTMARRILERAEKLGAGLPEHQELLSKCAGQGACAASDAAELLLHHVEASRGGPGPLTEVQRELLKLAALYLEKPSSLKQNGALVKTAEILDTFDRQHGLHRRYDRDVAHKRVERPEDVLFAVTGEKMAALVRDNVETITGNLYKLADLERLRGIDLQEWLGEDYAQAMTGSDGIFLNLEKAAAVIKTMPRSDAVLLDQLMSERGLQPWAKTAAASQRKLDWGRLKELAAQR